MRAEPGDPLAEPVAHTDMAEPLRASRAGARGAWKRNGTYAVPGNDDSRRLQTKGLSIPLKNIL